MLTRRQFVISLSSLGLLSGCGVLRGFDRSAAPRVRRVGVLIPFSSAPGREAFADLQQGLAELGYVDGQTIAYEARDASGGTQTLDFARELVQLPVDVIFAGGAPTTVAARQATAVIPIVGNAVSDPVGLGLAASLAHPGGNVTGTTNVPPSVNGKRLELLARLLPGVSRVAVVADFSDSPSAAQSTTKVQATTTAADALGVQLKTLAVRSPDDVEQDLAEARAWSAQAMLVYTGVSATIAAVPRFAEFQMQSRIPVVIDTAPTGTTRGALMSYTYNVNEVARLAAGLVDKILKGASPGDLPFQQPTVFDFVVNTTVAQALGISVPPDLAQEVTHWEQ